MEEPKTCLHSIGSIHFVVLNDLAVNTQPSGFDSELKKKNLHYQRTATKDIYVHTYIRKNKTILTCAMNFLSGEADVERVGGVSSAGQLHTQLRRRHAGELTRSLAEVRVLR